MEGEKIHISITDCDICGQDKPCLVEPGPLPPHDPDPQVLYKDECAFCLDCIQKAFAESLEPKDGR